jgi:hypothetical protein
MFRSRQYRLVVAAEVVAIAAGLAGLAVAGASEYIAAWGAEIARTARIFAVFEGTSPILRTAALDEAAVGAQPCLPAYGAPVVPATCSGRILGRRA